MDKDMNLSQRCMFQELVTNGCPQRTAYVIAKGTTFRQPDQNWTFNPPFYRGVAVAPELEIFPRPRFCYVAGPMRGVEGFNFPRFDQTRDELVASGYAVINPADIDRASGVNEAEDDPFFTVGLIKKFVMRDFHAIFFMDADKGDRIALLPGWENSTGAYAETGLARWLTLPFIDEFGNPLRYAGYDQQALSDAMHGYIHKLRHKSGEAL